VWYANPLRVRPQILVYKNVPGLSTVGEFLLYIEQWIDTDNRFFQIYFNLKKINLYIGAQGSPAIIVNNKKIDRRQYIPRTNTTDLYVNYGNVMVHDILTVGGDQSKAGAYYYNPFCFPVCDDTLLLQVFPCDSVPPELEGLTFEWKGHPAICAAYTDADGNPVSLVQFLLQLLDENGNVLPIDENDVMFGFRTSSTCIQQLVMTESSAALIGIAMMSPAFTQGVGVPEGNYFLYGINDSGTYWFAASMNVFQGMPAQQVQGHLIPPGKCVILLPFLRVYFHFDSSTSSFGTITPGQYPNMRAFLYNVTTGNTYEGIVNPAGFVIFENLDIGDEVVLYLTGLPAGTVWSGFDSNQFIVLDGPDNIQPTIIIETAADQKQLCSPALSFMDEPQVPEVNIAASAYCNLDTGKMVIDYMISWNLLPNPAVSIYYDIVDPGHKIVGPISLQGANGKFQFGTITINTPLPAGQHTFIIVATDENGVTVQNEQDTGFPDCENINLV